MMRDFLNRITKRVYIDFGKTHISSIFLSGVGRSGTTWLSDIINYRNEYRYIFEPFLPAKVPEASVFEYIQYIRPSNRDEKFINAADSILTGRIKRNAWTDFNNKKFIATKRLIKDIRTNLMLKWLFENFQGMPIILLLRHPCAVANSWSALNWGKEVLGTRNDLDICLNQEELVEDYLSLIKREIIPVKDIFERHIFLWSIMNYVPLSQFKKGQIHLVFYEKLCQNPIEESKRLFYFLGKEMDERIKKFIRKPSSQVRKDSEILKRGDLIDGWRKNVSTRQTKRAIEILSYFDLDAIYSEESMPDIDAAYEKLSDK